MNVEKEKYHKDKESKGNASLLWQLLGGDLIQSTQKY